MGGHPETKNAQSSQKGLRAFFYARKENAYDWAKAFAESRKITATKTQGGNYETIYFLRHLLHAASSIERRTGGQILPQNLQLFGRKANGNRRERYPRI